MNDPILFKRLFDVFVLPPGGPMVVLAVALLLRRYLPVLATTLSVAALTALYFACTGAVGSWLIAPIEQRYRAQSLDRWQALMRQEPGRRPQAIVVLGGGSRRGALDAPDGETVNSRTLERLVAGARVQRATGLPILVSGGTPPASQRPEAALMARTLDELGGSARWVESASADTAENATGTRNALAAHGIRRIVLVTHAYHLPRAVPAFERAGFDVMAMPAAWLAQPVDTWRAWLPTLSGLETTWTALHERAGLLWYGWRALGAPPGRQLPGNVQAPAALLASVPAG